MNSSDYIEIIDILSIMLNELVSEEEKLTEIIDTHSYRINELNQQIDVCRKNEDIDFRVFSPRNISFDNSEKISALETECSACERERSDAEKRLSVFTGKIDKLRRVLSLLKKNSHDVLDEEYPIDSDVKHKDPFDFIINGEDEEDLEDEQKSNISADNTISDSNVDVASQEAEDSSEEITSDRLEGVPVDEIKRVCHKVEFSEKIINNDRVRARLELKDIINDLKELIRVYDNE